MKLALKIIDCLLSSLLIVQIIINLLIENKKIKKNKAIMGLYIIQVIALLTLIKDIIKL